MFPNCIRATVIHFSATKLTLQQNITTMLSLNCNFTTRFCTWQLLRATQKLLLNEKYVIQNAPQQRVAMFLMFSQF